MKNTTFAFMFALVSIFGIHTAASAQFIPASEALLNTAHLAQLSTSGTVHSVPTAIPAATILTTNLVPVSPTVISLPTYTVASASTINTAAIEIMSNASTNNPISIQAYPNATTLINSELVPMITANTTPE